MRYGPEGDNGFDTNTMKSAVSARVSELDASVSRYRVLQFDHYEDALVIDIYENFDWNIRDLKQWFYYL